MHFFVNCLKPFSDAKFEGYISEMRRQLAAAGLEVPAVEESLVRSTDSLTDLTVVTDCLHALHAYTVSFNVMMAAHSLLTAAPLTPLWCIDSDLA